MEARARRPRRGAALLLAALPALASAARAQELPPAAEVVARYVEAVGGEAALRRHSSRTLVTETELTGMGVRMTTTTRMAPPARVVTTTPVEGMGTRRAGFDGVVGWSVDPVAGPVLLEGAELEQMVHRADFLGPLRYGLLFTSMETTARAEHGGRPCWRVELVSPSGRRSWQCFDIDTGLLVATGGEQVSRVGTVDATVLLSDYRDFDGVRMATRSTTVVMGQPVVVTLKSVSHAPVDPAAFEPPEEIRALLAKKK